ncbi:HEAT repeat domain-containing protein [Kribbella sp. NPDC006257]|uniref:HEAT repeat domain-containing protein n=1 Tax=Kribbella sp. NPDC006257 TaxID=3156738 RepID=UPI0033AAC32A
MGWHQRWRDFTSATPNVERLKDRGDVPRLVKALHFEGNEAVRRAAAQALGEVGDRQVIPVLVTAMAGDVCMVAAAAAGSVAALGADGLSVEDLAGALVSSRRWHEDPNRECSCRWQSELIMGITRMVRARVRPDHLQLMVGLLNDRDEELREFAAMILKTIGPPAAVSPLVARLPKESPNLVVRRVIFETIASFSDPSTLPILVACISETPPDDFRAFRWMAEALAKSNLPGLADALATVIPELRSVDRREILANIVRRDLGSPVLAEAANAKAETIDRRRPVEQALAAQHIQSLIDLLDTEFSEEAQRGLSGITDDRMYDELILLLRGDHWEFAAAELGRRREHEAIFPLIDRALNGNCDVSGPLAQLGVADQDEFLLAALDQQDLRSRAVSRVNPALAIDRLQRIAADEDVPYHVRYLAQSRTATPPTGDPYQISVDLLMSALTDLGLGRHIGTTPYQPGAVLDATLPRPGYVDAFQPSGRLFQEEYTYNSPEDGSWQRWRTPGYHWNARRAGNSYGGVGTYFTATVRADGLVEFDGGGIDGPYPADRTGWHAITAALNHFAPGLQIRLSS